MDGALGEAMISRDPEALRTVLGQGIFFATQMGDPLREEEEPEDEEGDENDEEGEQSLQHRLPKSSAPGSRH
ncbi:hypothetical protein [Luteibacter sp. dw_328]|uniref:hypothetical protein n=1 Tax=Luteibacter sp. dw_328 TaxID=2719796 RepID=UPI001BD629E9|nr:hypothetical protein [Luteibacter sp. dw_328]